MAHPSSASADDDLDDLDSVLAPLLAEEAKEKSQDHDDEFDLLEKELEANIGGEGAGGDKPPASASSFTHIPRPRVVIPEERQKPFQAVLDEYTSIIPSQVTTYFLNQCGIDNPDEKTRKIISLAVERFISELTTDALHYTKFHSQPKDTKSTLPKKEGKLVLTMEDLTMSLRDYGVNLTKPEYFSDTPFNSAKDKKSAADKTKDTKRKAAATASASSSVTGIGIAPTAVLTSPPAPAAVSLAKDNKNPVKKKKITEN